MNEINILITTTSNAKEKETFTLLDELSQIIPNSIVSKSNEPKPNHNILFKINEQHNKPYSIYISSNTDEINLPSIEFSIIEYKDLQKLRNKSILSSFMSPELVVNNFTTEIGAVVVDWLMLIFPMKIDNLANRVVSFHVVNDFILFRTHRYRFQDKENVDFQDIGPHITFRLRKIENGNDVRIIKYDKNDYSNGNVIL